MAQVHIPDSLLQEIERISPPLHSADEFVVQAVREKLSLEERKGEFYRLSDENRAAIDAQGVTETAVLEDFEAFRNQLNERRDD
jgi:hypothetical protein